MTAVQDGPTSIRVSWTPSSDATGYRIHYTSSRGDSGSEDVSGGHTDSHTLTGLVKEDTYTISIMATSHTLSSSPITVEITLSEEDPLIGERERANLVVQLARFFYISRSLRAPIPNKRNVNAMLDAVRMCCCSTPRALHLYYIQLALRLLQLAALLVCWLPYYKFLHQPFDNSFCRILLGSLPLANNVQHSASLS